MAAAFTWASARSETLKPLSVHPVTPMKATFTVKDVSDWMARGPTKQAPTGLKLPPITV